MPDVRPFTGIRYASTEALADLVCPPYDVISAAEQQELYDRHAHNAVRLELPQGEGTERYAHAAELFRGWLGDGVLAAEDRSALYVYRQDFRGPDGTRRRVAGVLGALALEPFGEDAGVLPHERTMPGPKADRLALMRALPVNVSPIYAIYRGGGDLAPFFDELEHRPPTARFVRDEILNRLWVISATGEIEVLRSALSPGPLVIADGHHRYETALEFHAERRTSGAHDSIMCFCVDADVEGLVVLPYHRAFSCDVSADELADRLTASFDAEEVASGDLDSALANRDGHAFGFLFPDRAPLVVRAGRDAVATTLGERHPAWLALDVVVLHEAVLPRILQGANADFTFSRHRDEIERLVSDKEVSAGVVMTAVAAPQVVDVARSGERMPQKASYFWPKVPTGLAFRPLD